MAHLYVIAGHGAGDPGACAHGYSEAERVRALMDRIKHFGGDNVTCADRNRNYYADNGIMSLNIPQSWQIIELHMDSAGAGARGAHVIIHAGAGGADRYDKALATFLTGILPGRSRSIVERSELANPARAAAMGFSYRLVEVGFISDAGDLQIFNSRIDDIAKGILHCFDIAVASTGRWKQDCNGWWYEYAGGGYAKAKWEQLGGEWYWFDGSGYAVTGWRQIGGKWYYFGDDCTMQTGWQHIGGRWYYLHHGGDMHIGWVQYAKDGKWYYLDADGGMVSDEFRQIGGQWYRFDTSGKMLEATTLEVGKDGIIR